jgi:hypothetical protein
VADALALGEKRLAAAEPVLRHPPIRDVARDPEQRDHRAVDVELRHEPRLEVPQAHRRLEAELHHAPLTGRDDLPQSSLPGEHVLGGETQLADRAAPGVVRATGP